MDNELIEESYKAYEKAKAQAGYLKKSFQKKSEAKKVDPTTKNVEKTLEVRFDLSSFRASHVLALTKIIPKKAGTDKISLFFKIFSKDPKVSMASVVKDYIRRDENFFQKF